MASPTRWWRIEPLMGAAAVVLWAISWELWSAGDKPGGDYQTAEVVSWFDDARWTIIGGAAVYSLGTAAFIWFLACLRDALAVGGWADRLARVAFGSGVAAAVLLTCSFAPSVAGAGTFAFGDQRGISPGAAEALYALTDGFVVLAEFVAVGLFLAAGLVAVRRRVLPTWLGIVTLLIAAVLLVLPIGFVGVIFLMPVWTIIVAPGGSSFRHGDGSIELKTSPSSHSSGTTAGSDAAWEGKPQRAWELLRSLISTTRRRQAKDISSHVPVV